MLSHRLHLDENAGVRSAHQPGLIKPGATQSSTRGTVSSVPSASAGPVKPAAASNTTTRRAFGVITNSSGPATSQTAPGTKPRTLQAAPRADAAPVKAQARVATAKPARAPQQVQPFVAQDFAEVEFVHGTDLFPAGGRPYETGVGIAPLKAASSASIAAAAATAGPSLDFGLPDDLIMIDMSEMPAYAPAPVAVAGGSDLPSLDNLDLDLDLGLDLEDINF